VFNLLCIRSSTMRKFILLILFTALLVYLSGCNIKRSAVKTYAKYVKEAPYDVIIVPGIPFDSLGSNSLLKARIYWAKYLYDNGLAKNIIFSGGAIHNCYVEGKVMKIFADSLGIPPSHTFSEVNAEHSIENVYLGWRMAHKMGYTKIALATDPFQSYTLGSFINRYTPGMARLPLQNADSLYKKDLPKANLSSAYVCGTLTIEKRMGFFQRLRQSFSIDTAALNRL
ncbi:MAG: YdcF family protein, partial [Sphingobacteriales bacterium]